MDIDALQAGPELDALVAEEVMGWVDDFTENPPKYSTDIAAAWEVVEAIKRKGWSWWFSDCNGPAGTGEMKDGVQLPHQHGATAAIRRGCCENTFASDFKAPTMALAICRAALKAVGA